MEHDCCKSYAWDNSMLNILKVDTGKDFSFGYELFKNYKGHHPGCKNYPHSTPKERNANPDKYLQGYQDGRL